MTTSIDFSDLYFVNDEWPRIPKSLPGLNETDSAIVRWLRGVTADRDDPVLDLDAIAWIAARVLTSGGVVVWLAQERTLLDGGLRELLGDFATRVPEPWAGFLRWCSDDANLECFRSWPPYTSEEPLDVARARARQPRRRRP